MKVREVKKREERGRMCKHECGRATNVAKQRMWQSHECCKATNVAKPRMPSANVFDDCLFKGEEKLREGKRGEEKNLILILFLILYKAANTASAHLTLVDIISF